ncbi:uncharacterized protein EDB93DRAFT_1255705 [Suillus bovinus]|uniref:uncharacterized protein n=1 Tax=Suillus bovinus TaxID=48563 RepID=UPI001B879751|nr:uncharacterized protein EDB93DRAFT_1255705 [Suillus bovinus]KAG2130814.1 hypothetical protein EDB93DRAFT_1255705 [Suillus bovinus]
MSESDFSPHTISILEEYYESWTSLTEQSPSLDISSHALASAIKYNFPAANASYARWEPLEVNGGLEIFNPAFVNAEYIVATKTFISSVEHLPEAILTHFAPTILDVYHPRSLLVTTPSYGFNAHFNPPGLTNTATGFPDKHTDMAFRRLDHIFEWTVEEFQEWCRHRAGMRIRREKDKWGRDEELGGASQVAVFKHLEGEAWATRHEEKSTQIEERSKCQKEHRLLNTHHYHAHVHARKRGSVEEIAKDLSNKGNLVIEEIGAMCGGWFEGLIEAIEAIRGGLARKKRIFEWAQEEPADDLFEEVLQSEGYRSDDDPGFDLGSGLYSSDSGVDLLWDMSKDGNAQGKESVWTGESCEDDVVDWSRWSSLAAAWDLDRSE